MRVLLDAHVSGRRIAPALRALGHDVRAVNEERALDGIGDDQLLGLAAGEGRVLVTFDVRDFHRIATEWAEAGRSLAGCAILVGIDHSEFNLIIRRLEELFLDRSDPRSWRDFVCFVTRSR